METVNFYPNTFGEIPRQDNPAFGGSECMMIVRENHSKFNSKRACVLYIKPDPIESVNNIAIFYRESEAIKFCSQFKAEDYEIDEDITEESKYS